MTVDHDTLPSAAILPTALATNAWTGERAAAGELVTRPAGWIVPTMPRVTQLMRPPRPADPTDPTDCRVGWALVLPARDNDADDLAHARDAEQPLQDLLAHRGPAAKVLRYRPDYGHIALFEADGTPVPTSGAAQGVAPGCLPRYLLLAAGPDVLPWALQYTLAAVCAVGRLHLTGLPLGRYVEALRRNSPVGPARYGAPLVWAVDHGDGDITALMRTLIAQTIYDDFRADSEMRAATLLDGSRATTDGLSLALATGDPALVVTTSHGMTGPLTDAAMLRRDLGLPVDTLRSIVTADEVLTAWAPNGAVWYSHACCSAGSDSPSAYTGLLDPQSDVHAVLTAVANLGPTVAPLPTALLGAAEPVRAFIGHVEPTFDWTIEFPWTRTALTASIRTALYHGISRGEPVGYAMQQVWRDIGPLRQAHADAVRLYEDEPDQARRGLTAALYCRLAASDRAGTVVLGDPAARLPLPN